MKKGQIFTVDGMECKFIKDEITKWMAHDVITGEWREHTMHKVIGRTVKGNLTIAFSPNEFH